MAKSCLRHEVRGAAHRTTVIPGLVPGIHPSTRAAPGCTLDPGNKCRDDMCETVGRFGDFGSAVHASHRGAGSTQVSALPPKADMRPGAQNFRYVPEADIRVFRCNARSPRSFSVPPKH